MPGRQHHFLDCPVATSIYNTIQEQLDERDIPFLIWTVTPPLNFPKYIWAYICLAAANAMNNGRKYLYSQTYHQDPPQGPSSELGHQAGFRAIDDFWSLLDLHTEHMPDGQPEHERLPLLHWNPSASHWQLHTPHQRLANAPL